MCIFGSFVPPVTSIVLRLIVICNYLVYVCIFVLFLFEDDAVVFLKSNRIHVLFSSVLYTVNLIKSISSCNAYMEALEKFQYCVRLNSSSHAFLWMKSIMRCSPMHYVTALKSFSPRKPYRPHPVEYWKFTKKLFFLYF
jgi:hypothetical protein